MWHAIVCRKDKYLLRELATENASEVYQSLYNSPVYND